MAKRFVIPFASTGDKSTTPDATDPGGAISYSQGWPVAYQLPDTDPAYRPVGRQEMNGVLFDITGAIAELQTLGFPEWVAVTGLVTPYIVNAWVRRLGNVYFNTVVNNSAAPEAVGSGWVEVSTVSTGRLLKTIVVTGSGTFTPLAASKLFRVRGVGGGGGAAGLNPTAAGTYNVVGGGASGGYSEGWFTSAQIGASIGCVIGQGGIAGTPGLDAGPGGVTSLGALLTIPGGGGSIGISTFPSATGSLSVGGVPGALPTGGSVVNMRGAPGGFGINTTNSGQAIAGTGGSNPLGVGGHSPSAPATYNPGTGFGSGAGGAVSPASYGATPGIAGQPGVLIIEEYA